jgi:hypothetical protein
MRHWGLHRIAFAFFGVTGGSAILAWALFGVDGLRTVAWVLILLVSLAMLALRTRQLKGLHVDPHRPVKPEDRERRRMERERQRAEREHRRSMREEALRRYRSVTRG